MSHPCRAPAKLDDVEGEVSETQQPIATDCADTTGTPARPANGVGGNTCTIAGVWWTTGTGYKCLYRTPQNMVSKPAHHTPATWSASLLTTHLHLRPTTRSPIIPNHQDVLLEPKCRRTVLHCCRRRRRRHLSTVVSWHLSPELPHGSMLTCN